MRKNNHTKLSSNHLKEIFLSVGADDVGFVEIGRPALKDSKEAILELFSNTKTLVSVVVSLNRPNLCTPARNLTSYEIHNGEDLLGELQGKVLKRLRKEGYSGLALPAAFPMDIEQLPNKRIGVSHKIVAEQSGMGLMGLSRLVLHPEWGSAIILGSMLLDCEVDSYGSPVVNSPCINCQICVDACPVGAIKADGSFDFSACGNHNYRELIFGFLDWVDALVSSGDMIAYRSRFSDSETLSWWQSLAYKPNYKCNHCMGVCPAGSTIIQEYIDDPDAYVAKVVQPLIERVETVYAVPGSDAEGAALRNPAKKVKSVLLSR